jgi:hypothetical protein
MHLVGTSHSRIGNCVFLYLPYNHRLVSMQVFAFLCSFEHQQTVYHFVKERVNIAVYLLVVTLFIVSVNHLV